MERQKVVANGSMTHGVVEPDLIGPLIILTRGEPVEIEVVNRLKERTAIHGHGIELESYYDGVPGWSGVGSQITDVRNCQHPA
jgi:FtsP/CotA-like multicopper oxidase with cupredoxin domain